MNQYDIELDLDFDAAMKKLSGALPAAKLGIVSEIDVQKVMKHKLDKDIPAYRILGACAPDLALQAIEAAPTAGTLLPCNIVVRELGVTRTGISFMDPVEVLALANSPAYDAVAQEARGRIQTLHDQIIK
jgi:uncharacterized protein (DUF302 family)